MHDRRPAVLSRQFATALLTVLLAACESDTKQISLGAAPAPDSFRGVIVADEPRAALIGRDTLVNGGNAVDAAVAAAMAMAVTLPSRASLAGGGVCVVYDKKTNTTNAVDFSARAAAAGSQGAERPSAVPGTPRGLSVLHARFGRQHWSRLLAPAEAMARFGVPVSRALESDMAPVSAALLADPSFRRVFAAAGGDRLLKDGEILVQPDLAQTISRLRTGGPAAFYSGRDGERLAAAVTAAGGSLAAGDMTGDEAAWRPTIRVETGDDMAHFPAAPFVGGASAALDWAMLVDRDRFEDASDRDRPHLLVETARRAYAQRPLAAATEPSRAALDALVNDQRIHRLMEGFSADRLTPEADLGAAGGAAPENPAAASVIAADAEGNGVACSVTANSLFGIGRIAGDTGLIPAAAPGPGGRGATALTPMLIINENSKEFRFAAAASGGPVAPPALVQTAATVVLAGKEPAAALAVARFAANGASDQVRVEDTLTLDVADGLAARGYRLVAARPFGSVMVISCPDGLPPNPDSCRAAADPRTFGLVAATN